jgi:hypothetical protein
MPPTTTLSATPTTLYPSAAVSSDAVSILRESAANDLNKRTQFYTRKATLTLCPKTTYVKLFPTRRRNTNPFSHLSFAFAYLLSISSVDQYKSTSRTAPREEIRENQCESVSKDLNKRTQFPPSNPTLTSFTTTTYLYPFHPALNRTNPISPPSAPVPRPLKLLTPESCLLIPVLNKRTQFPRPPPAEPSFLTARP